MRPLHAASNSTAWPKLRSSDAAKAWSPAASVASTDRATSMSDRADTARLMAYGMATCPYAVNADVTAALIE